MNTDARTARGQNQSWSCDSAQKLPDCPQVRDDGNVREEDLAPGPSPEAGCGSCNIKLLRLLGAPVSEADGIRPRVPGPLHVRTVSDDRSLPLDTRTDRAVIHQSCLQVRICMPVSSGQAVVRRTRRCSSTRGAFVRSPDHGVHSRSAGMCSITQLAAERNREWPLDGSKLKTTREHVGLVEWP